MSDRPQSSADMAAAELNIREAMALGSLTARLNAIMNLYWRTPQDKRDALVSVLVARLTLVPPSRSAA